jgi:hypothetical protein|tara:strand:+ start:36 stop:890 length:855 start_codon:yes stop_codon:yes gene_type:complete
LERGLINQQPFALEMARRAEQQKMQQSAQQSNFGQLSNTPPMLRPGLIGSVMESQPMIDRRNAMGTEMAMNLMPGAGITKAGIRAFHGTRGNITKFDKSKIRENDYDLPVNGFWFSSHADEASPAFTSPTNIMPVEIALNNPAPFSKVRQVANQVREDGKLRVKSRSADDETRYRLQELGYDGVVASGIDRKMLDLQKLESTGQIDFIDIRGYKKSLKHQRNPNKEGFGGLDLFDGHGARDAEHITGYGGVDDFLEANSSKDYIVFEPEQITGRFGGLPQKAKK